MDDLYPTEVESLQQITLKSLEYKALRDKSDFQSINAYNPPRHTWHFLKQINRFQSKY